MSAPSTELAYVSTRQDDWKYAQVLATAGLLPRQYRDSPGDVLLAMEYARSLTLPLAQIFVGIHVIDGRPSMSADLMQALVRRAGHGVVIETREDAARCTITRGDDGSTTVATFTEQDARRAGLIPGKPGSNWARYPQDMLVARAVSRACRRAAADVLAGVAYTPEELGAPEPIQGLTVVDQAEPNAQQQAWLKAEQDEAFQRGEAARVAQVVAEREAQARDRKREADAVYAQSRTLHPDPEPPVRIREPEQAADEERDAQAAWRGSLDAAFLAQDGLAVASLMNEALAAGWGDLVSEAQAHLTELGGARGD